MPVYTVQVTNNGPSPTRVDLVLSMDAPPYAVTTTTHGACGTMTATDDVSCPLGDIAAGATATARVQVPQAGSGTHSFTATANHAGTDPVSGNDTMTVNRNVAPALVGTKGEVVDSCTASGTAGADLMSGTGGSDVLCGFDGDDTLVGRREADALIGGPGTDTADYRDATGGVVANLDHQDAFVPAGSTGDSGYDTYRSVEVLRGSPYKDTLIGFTTKAGRLYGLGGADTLHGYDGGDWLYGGGGADVINGRAGNDWQAQSVVATPLLM